MKVLQNNYIRSILYLFGVALWGICVYAYRGELSRIYNVSIIALLSLILLQLLLLVISGLYLKTLLGLLTGVSLGEAITIFTFSSLGDYFLPIKAGVGLRFAYFKGRYNLKIQAIGGRLILSYYFPFMVSLFFCILSIYKLTQITPELSDVLNILIIIFIILGLLGLSWFRRVLKVVVTKAIHSIRVGDMYEKFEGNIFGSVRRGDYGWLYFWVTASFVLSVMVVGIEVIALGITTSFWGVVLYVALANLSLFISITPAGIGITEGFLIITSRLFGMNTADVMSISVLTRATSVIALCITALFLLAVRTKNRKSLKRVPIGG